LRIGGDCGIVPGSQLLVGLSGWWAARVKGVPFVLEVRDLWPESLAAVGMGNADSWLHRGLGKIAGFLYRKAEHIVVVTPAFRERLVSHWQVPASKISVIQNGVETELFSPRNSDQVLRKQLNAEGKFLVSFIGTLGLAHGLNTVIEAAECLASAAPEVMFMLLGEGADRERIAALAHAKKLNNICLIPQQSRKKIPAYISASDVCLVLLKKSEVFETVIPTKMLEFMSCARPVILGVGGQAKQILERSRAGICVEPENPAALCDAILRLRQDRELCESLGRNGREYIANNLSRQRTAAEYLETLRGLIDGSPVAEPAAAA
jgi:glycosyltransferase involved in cell wall biosynthesis